MERKTLLTGSFYFLIFSALFFVFMFWMARVGFSPHFGGSGDQIALIRIEGIITDAKEVTDLLTQYRDNDRIKAILLRIDSPGGAVVPSQEIYDSVLKIRKAGVKKVVTSMGTIAASGGYYIAAASDFIMANPGTLTGSLGVIMELSNVEGLLKKIGIESVVIKSGKNKDVGSPLREMTKEERLLLQNVSDDIHNQFIEAVAEGRSLEIEGVKRLADGRVFTGRQAKEVGLVDGLGNLEDAVEKTAKLAGIEGKPEIIEMQRGFSFFETLQSKFLGNPFSFSPMGFHYLLSF
jgi:protease-4